MSRTAIHLRAYRPDDAETTRGVFLRAVQVTAASDYTPTQIGAWISASDDASAWAAARSLTRNQIAEVDGTVAGFIGTDSSGYIDMLYVDPEYTRQGVASALLRWAENTARAAGVPVMTTHASVTAVPFFRAHGFQIVSKQHPQIGTVVLTNFLMQLQLTDPENA